MIRDGGRSFSRLPLVLGVPLSFLKGRTLSRLHSYFTIGTFFSIFFSTVLLLLASAGTNGVDAELRERIAGLDSHILLSLKQREELICDYDDLERRIASRIAVLGIAPYLWIDVHLRTDSGQSFPALLKGVIPQKERLATDIDRYLGSGDLSQALVENPQQAIPLVVGRVTADALGVHAGDTLVVSKPGLSSVRNLTAVVTDVFQSGTPHDAEVVYTTLGKAQETYGDDNNCVHAVAVRTADPLTSAAVANSIQELVGDRFEVADWSVRYPNYKAGLQLLKTWILVLNYTIFVFAVMFSVGVVLLVLTQKRRELALLLTLGMHPRALRASVGIVGALLGTIGVVAGVTLAPFICKLLTKSQAVKLPADQTLLTFVPFIIDPVETAAIAFSQIIIPAIFGWFAAGDVGRINPAAVLRDE